MAHHHNRPLWRHPQQFCASLSGAVVLLISASALMLACGTSQPAGTGAATSARNFALTLTIAGDGDVHALPVDLDCSASCSAEYAAGTRISLLARPAGDAQFGGWGGDCNGVADCVVTLDRARTVSVAFVAPAATAPAGRWLKGDLHVHTDHSSDGSLPRQLFSEAAPGNNPVSAQIGEAERVGLDFVSLTDHRTYDQHYDPLWQSSKLLLLRGEEANGSPHATVHGAVDTIVQGAHPDGMPEFYRLQQSIWDAHSQNALWVTAHPDDGETEDDGTPNARASAQGVDLVEAWNRASDPDAEIDYCENRWNAGFRFGIAGGSDDHFIELWALAGPGSPNTHVFAADASTRGLLDGLQRGRVSISPDARAPMVTLSADGDGDGIFETINGDELTVAAGTKLRVRVRVQRGIGDTVTLYRAPGRSAGALREFMPTQLDQSYELTIDSLETPDWIRAEVRGIGLAAGIDPVQFVTLPGLAEQLQLVDQLRAIASPIFIAPQPVAAHAELELPAAIGIEDDAQWVAGARERYAGFADIAAVAGVAHVVLETQDHDTSRIVYRTRGADGRWRAAPRVISDDARNARFARVVARGDQVFVVWQDESVSERPHRPRIRLRRSRDGGANWLPIETVRDTDGRAEHPAIALDADGRPVIAWQEIHSGAPFDVMLQIVGSDPAPSNMSRNGKIVVAANPVDSRSARDPASVWPTLAVSQQGALALAWQDNREDSEPLWTGASGVGEGTNPDNWQIAVRTRAVGADAWSPLKLLGSATQAERHPALAYADDGTLVAAWDVRELRASGANLSVQAARSDDGGVSFNAPQTLAPDAAAMSQYPRLGVDADGRVRAVWYDARAADWRWRVMTATLGADGWDAGTLLLSPGINSWPASSGGLLVFSSTRNARRLQRDRTQQIYLTELAR